MRNVKILAVFGLILAACSGQAVKPVAVPISTSSSTTTTTAVTTTTTVSPTTTTVDPLMAYCVQQGRALYARYPAQTKGRDPVARCRLILAGTADVPPVVDRAGVDDRIHLAELEFSLDIPVAPPTTVTTTTTMAPPVTTTSVPRLYCSVYYKIPGQTGPLYDGQFEDRVYATGPSLDGTACTPVQYGGTWVPKDPSWVFVSGGGGGVG